MNVLQKKPEVFENKKKEDYEDTHFIHPNEPCPCGSGKKYKKCCGKK